MRRLPPDASAAATVGRDAAGAAGACFGRRGLVMQGLFHRTPTGICMRCHKPSTKKARRRAPGQLWSPR